jgi:hypothetical protein
MVKGNWQGGSPVGSSVFNGPMGHIQAQMVFPIFSIQGKFFEGCWLLKIFCQGPWQQLDVLRITFARK